VLWLPLPRGWNKPRTRHRRIIISETKATSNKTNQLCMHCGRSSILRRLFCKFSLGPTHGPAEPSPIVVQGCKRISGRLRTDVPAAAVVRRCPNFGVTRLRELHCCVLMHCVWSRCGRMWTAIEHLRPNQRCLLHTIARERLISVGHVSDVRVELGSSSKRVRCHAST
jgi:hypothetical protein